MKDFQKDFTNKEKRALRKEFDNSTDVRNFRKEIDDSLSIYFVFFTFIVLFSPIYLNDLTSIFLFIFISISGLISFSKSLTLSRRIQKEHLLDYTEWLKEKNIKY